ncbi:ABC transporter permease [Bacillus sp. FSL K6-1003]|uniref:ABC transporter permease n=1 Tax=Bacillus sp. FSL K6-1003 TaxID=2954675 RepID=UPI0030D1FF11
MVVKGQNLNKRIKRRIKNNKYKLSIIFLVIFVSTTIFTSFFVGSNSVLKSIISFNEKYNVESGTFISNHDEYIDNSRIKVEKNKYKEIRHHGKTIRIFKPRNLINKYQITSGTDIKTNNDILLDKNFLKENNLKIGDTININSKKFSIVGTAISPDYITTKNSDLVLQANAKKFGIAFIKSSCFEKMFSGEYLSYYSYTSNLSLHEIVAKLHPEYINDSKNNTRIQQVIGDAKAPRDLSILLTCIFYLITIGLLSVYHYEVSKKENKNITVLLNLGYKKIDLFKHYVKETNIILAISWVFGIITGTSTINVIMQMNSKIYNYPELNIDFSSLIIVIFSSFFMTFIANNIIVFRFYFRNKNKKYKHSNKSVFFRINIPFYYKFRLLKIFRNKRELLIFISLIFFVGLLMNFSLLLKDSVSEYVKDLKKENKFNQIYFINQGDYYKKKKDDEEVKLYTLYDENNITQNVYVINKNSKYFNYNLTLEEGDVIVSKAYSEKYNKNIGDYITLKDIIKNDKYKFKIKKINNSSTTSNIYLVKKESQAIFNKNIYFNLALTTSHRHTEIEEPSAILSREEIITSGHNILQVINKQISLIIIIAIVFQSALLFSLLEFILQNNIQSINILKLQGYNLNELMKMHFGFNFILAIICVLLSYLLSNLVVRIFLDGIMFDFKNFVEVTGDFKIFLISNLVILVIYLFYLYRIRNKIFKL